MYRTIIITGFSALLICLYADMHAQSLNNYVNDAQHLANGNQNSGVSISSLSNEDITGALHEALQVGAKNATGKLSAVNGYFGTAVIKILMPPDAKKAESTLRDLGFGKQVDDAILSMNRGAEDAASKALPIFMDAIKNMTIDDGLSILQGGNGAATQYLKSKTSAALTTAFRPVISASLDKVNATKYWATVFNTYNGLPTTFKKVNPDLVSYVTERALNGLFVMMADEEAKIRLNPAARVSDLLQKVFGAH